MTNSCRQCQASFEITESDLAFYEKVSPVFDGKKYLVPAPTLCPACRMQHRMIQRNIRHLYQRKCDLTGEDIISCYSDKAQQKIYKNDVWWSDRWDALEYGVDFDFSKGFFEQFLTVRQNVPMFHQYVLQNNNCDYVNGAANCSNCYLSYVIDYCENCYYIQNGINCKSCVDCLGITDCELCYESIDLQKCYNVSFSQRCVNSSDSAFLIDCRRCRNCIGCINLTDKEYHIFNKPVSKEEFEAYRKQLSKPEKLAELKKIMLEYTLKFPKKQYFGHSNDHFSGDHLEHVKNTYYSFDGKELEDCKYCTYVFKAKDCMDLHVFGDRSELIYNCIATGLNCNSNIFCIFCFNSHNNAYCNLISGCSNCFGCSGLKNKQYCVLNKQYTKEAYEKLVPQIIEHMKQRGEWGEFFPPDMSPFSYNESESFDYFPFTQADAVRLGYRWSDIEYPVPQVEKVIPANRLPPNIQDVPDDILNWAITCEVTGRPFKVIKQELAFYREHDLPVPRRHPDQRHEDRMALRNPRKLWERQCDCKNSGHQHMAERCSNVFQTSYAPERPEIVYCEECYLKEVY